VDLKMGAEKLAFSSRMLVHRFCGASGIQAIFGILAVTGMCEFAGILKGFPQAVSRDAAWFFR
jgi:hypothetical protein